MDVVRIIMARILALFAKLPRCTYTKYRSLSLRITLRRRNQTRYKTLKNSSNPRIPVAFVIISRNTLTYYVAHIYVRYIYICACIKIHESVRTCTYIVAMRIIFFQDKCVYIWSSLGASTWKGLNLFRVRRYFTGNTYTYYQWCINRCNGKLRKENAQLKCDCAFVRGAIKEYNRGLGKNIQCVAKHTYVSQSNYFSFEKVLRGVYVIRHT